MTLATLLVAALAAFSPIKVPSHVELLDAQTVLVVYSDTSMAVGPLAGFGFDGSVRAGYPMTEVAAPVGHHLIAKWVDARGMEHIVDTDCVTLTPLDCALLHAKYIAALEKAFPLPAKPEPSK